MFSNYREKLAEFHNNIIENNNIDPALSDYLSENALKITSDSISKIRTIHPMFRISTGITQLINDIVTLNCDDFTGTCKDFENMLIQNIGAFKDIFQKIQSKTFNPIYLVKSGVFLIFNGIPIVNLIPTKLKDFLSNLFIFISVVETLLSLFTQMSIIRQIIAWISELPIF